MIASVNTDPVQDVYYLGSVVIDQLLNGLSDYFEIYDVVKSNYKISVQKFSLVLDWLYMIGLIDSSGEKIVLCS